VNQPEQKDFEREDVDESQVVDESQQAAGELEEETDMYKSPLTDKSRFPIKAARDKGVREVVGYYKVPEPKDPSQTNLNYHDHDVDVLTGDYHFHIQEKQNRNFLDANKVQIGTSILGAHDNVALKHDVAQYRIKFFRPFQYRPIILVTPVPDGDDTIGPHADVFVASVNEIRLDSFVVSVVRLDQYPNNGWGQNLHLDWIAIEYETNYPEAGPSSDPVQAFIANMIPANRTIMENLQKPVPRQSQQRIRI